MVRARSRPLVAEKLTHLHSSSTCPERHGMAGGVHAAVDASPPHIHTRMSRTPPSAAAMQGQPRAGPPPQKLAPTRLWPWIGWQDRATVVQRRGPNGVQPAGPPCAPRGILFRDSRPPPNAPRLQQCTCAFSLPLVAGRQPRQACLEACGAQHTQHGALLDCSEARSAHSKCSSAARTSILCCCGTSPSPGCSKPTLPYCN